MYVLVLNPLAVCNPQVKCFVYSMLCLAEDEENQKLGIVGLLYHVGEETNKPDPKLMKEGPATIPWIPIRFTGIHVCVNERMSSILARLLLLGGGSEFRARSRVHYGESSVFLFFYSVLISPYANSLAFFIRRHSYGIPVQTHDFWGPCLCIPHYRRRRPENERNDEMDS